MKINLFFPFLFAMEEHNGIHFYLPLLQKIEWETRS